MMLSHRISIIVVIILAELAISVPSWALSDSVKGAGPKGNVGLQAVQNPSTQIDTEELGRRLIAINVLHRDYRKRLQQLRGGPGEGASPHISPTETWKGVVRTNICNFRHLCK